MMYNKPEGVITRALRRSPGLKQMITSPVSLVLLALIAYAIYRFGPPLLSWLVLDADWQGSSSDDCTSGGACWSFIRVHMNRFMFGAYPRDEQWRVIVGFLLPVVAAIPLTPLVLRKFPQMPRYGGALLILGPLFTLALLHGGFAGLQFVPTSQWGGLLVTLVVGVLGILLSLPLGILLALGRRSTMPLVRVASTLYIEIWRGVPLLGVLFMTTLLLPLALPPKISVPQFYAVMVGIILYSAAYMAEVVRGGLLSIKPLQFEASDALGFSYWGKMRVIVLPQALYSVMPALVGIFINLFKSSTLVLVVGVFDLLGMVQNAAQGPQWAGHHMEGFVFVALVFWTICYTVSSYGEGMTKRRGKRNRDV